MRSSIKGCIKLIKSDSKDVCNVAQEILFFSSFFERILKKKYQFP